MREEADEREGPKGPAEAGSMDPGAGLPGPRGAESGESETGEAWTTEARSPTRVRRPGGRRWSALSVLWEWTRSVAVAFVLFLVVRTFLVEAFKIPTSSMEGTLLVGDFLLVNKAVYGAEIPATDLRLPAFDQPERGDVVVFHPPHDQVRNYVKRVVGAPGDTLEMRDKVLYLNGVGQEEPYARHRAGSGDAVHPSMSWQRGYVVGELHASDETYHPSRDNWGPLVVPADKYFVLGDNRDNSEDSRYWGFVEREDIRGRPLFVYYSFNLSASEQFSWVERVRWKRIGEPID